MCESPVSRERMVTLSNLAGAESTWDSERYGEMSLEVWADKPSWAGGRVGHLVFIPRGNHTRLLPCCMEDVLVNALFYTFFHQIL